MLLQLGLQAGNPGVVLFERPDPASHFQCVRNDPPHEGEGTLRFTPSEQPLELHDPRILPAACLAVKP
jgi:hypothetical protein